MATLEATRCMTLFVPLPDEVSRRGSAETPAVIMGIMAIPVPTLRMVVHSSMEPRGVLGFIPASR